MKTNKKIGRNVILLGIVSFFQDISSEMIFPILPLFLISLNATGIIIGIIGGIMECISSIFKVFSGYLSDRIGKHLYIVFSGYLVSSISKIILPFSTTWQHALIFLSLDRFGKGIRTAPRDAMIAEASYGNTGKAFGIHRMMDTSGAIVGSIISFILFYFFGLNFTTIIFIAGIFGFLSLVPFIFIKEKQKKQIKISLKTGIVKLPKNFKIFLFISSIFAFGNFTYMFFILKTQNVLSYSFNEFMSIAIPIILYAWFNLIYAIFSLPAGILSDKFGKEKVLALGYFLFSITCIGFIFSYSLISFIIFFALYGMAIGFIEGNQRAYASDLLPENLRGTGLGIFHTTIGLISLPAGLIAGILWEYNMTFIYGSILGIIASILMFLYILKNEKSYNVWR